MRERRLSTRYEVVLGTALLVTLGAGCHAHQEAGPRSATAEAEHKSERVSSPRPVGATPSSILKPEAVRKIQQALVRKGYPVAPTDTLNEATRHALEKFQGAEKLATTGFPDSDTVRHLGLDPVEIYRDSKSTD